MPDSAAVLDPSLARGSEGLRWYDARDLGVEGRGWSDTKAFYDRLPARAEGVVRPPVWELAQHSAGMLVRFVTDAAGISAHWRLRFALTAWDHMPATCHSGLDLYAKLEGRWRWAGVSRNPEYPDCSRPLAQGLAPGRREYMLYLPLYNGVEAVEIGVPEDATVACPPAHPAGAKPIVFYGTSIVQGGCASRPGMAYTAILGRMLDRPHLNLGFSGNGQSEPEMARLLAELDPSVYVLDALPNMTPDLVAERVEPFVGVLREARPRTPIVLVENVRYQGAEVAPEKRRSYESKNEQLAAAYRRLVDGGVGGLTYFPSDDLFGDDDEATVDGTHATDLGFLRMARALEPVLRPLV